MQLIIKNIINIIGLSKLLGYVWEIVYDELTRLASDSAATWDDKAVKVLDEIIKSVMKALETSKNNN